ncbi:MAG TPA: 2-dehydro-3-deoxygalactonokinase [Pseudoxanthomonas sp.]|nr:2-dehydro-3-deoxygalactonokinase [Pseudoxanthomonas sp.]
MIAVDWGSSSLRAWRLDDTGAVIDQRRSDQGVLSCSGAFASVLAALIDGWEHPVLVLSGMIGSRSGWHEMPYLDCPAGVRELAASLQSMQVDALPGRTLWFVPGIADLSRQVADVVRGEETQMCGLPVALQQGSHVVCLPGTHSKWITLQEGRIRSIHTAMTGEVYAVLRRHSLLGQLMDNDDSHYDAEAFGAGLQRSTTPGGLLHHLFGVRTAGLFARYSGSALPSYLSGLLIGHEVRASALPSRSLQDDLVHLVGSEGLLARYAHALEALGTRVQRHPEHLSATGLWRIAQARGLAG